jgi:DNA-binding CsgD family transcriptional regulator/tetratricopeptide (TPR) repeat protein
VEEELLTTGARGELRLALARLLLVAGDGAGAEQAMIRAASELRRRPVLAARAMALLAEMRPAQGGPHEQRVWLDAALRAVSRRGEPAVKIQVRAARAQFLLERGDPTAWRDVEALPWSAGADEERLELVRASKYLARAALGLGHYRRAEYFLDRGESIRDALDHMRFATGLASMRAWLEWRTGRWEGLEVRARNLIQASTGAPGTSVGNESIVGWLLLARGELDEAADRFAAILETIRRAPQARLLGPVIGALATIHLAGEDPDAARELAEVGIAEMRERGLWVSASALAPVAVDALIAVGATSDAGELVRDFSRGVRGRDAPAARAALDHCRGSLAEARGRRDRAVSAFAQSERAWRALPSPYDAARARIRRGRCLLVADQRVGAGCLVDALQELHALGASRDATAVREELRAQGVRLPPPWGPGRRSYGEELSPREVEVARLAARGHTNQEIAGELIVSVRTVEKHVSAVLRKLELESREAIAERLAQKR